MAAPSTPSAFPGEPDGVELHTEIGRTDRGVLWRGSRDRTDDRIVRVVDARFCDERFRRALKHVREQRHPQVLDITREGWVGIHYLIEYAVDPPWWTLGDALAACRHWSERLRLVALVCDSVARWERAPALPIGVNPSGVVLTGTDAEPTPWLAPCPPLTLYAPNDLIGLPAEALAAIAPETVRGVQLDQRAPEWYALGTLAAQAVGCRPAYPAADGAGLVEAQARGALLDASEARSDVEPFLHAAPPIRHLFRTIQRYRHPAPGARPTGVGDLSWALATSTDLLGLAEALRSGEPAAAVEVLSWSQERGAGQRISCLRLAAEICAERGDLPAALDYLDRAVALAPNQVDLREQRCGALWASFVDSPGEAHADRSEDLLADLAFLKRLDTSRDPGRYLRAAEVYRRRGDWEREADELYEASERDTMDPAILWRYAQCWLNLKNKPNAEAVVALGHRRVDALVQARILGHEMGPIWHARFDELLG